MYEQVLEKHDVTRVSNITLWADKLSVVSTTVAAMQWTALASIEKKINVNSAKGVCESFDPLQVSVSVRT